MNYATATEMERKPEKTKLAILMTIIGSEAVEVFNTFGWNNDEE